MPEVGCLCLILQIIRSLGLGWVGERKVRPDLYIRGCCRGGQWYLGVGGHGDSIAW